MKKIIFPLVFSFILFSLGAVFTYIYLGSPATVVSFDEQLLTKTFIRQLSERNLGVDHSKRLSHHFRLFLNESIKAYSKQHHVVILSDTSVVFGAEDITSKIQALIATKMLRMKQ